MTKHAACNIAQARYGLLGLRLLESPCLDSIPPRCDVRRRAFTIIELLVVITIIGLLLILTMSAVQRTRESARRITCANNLRQVGLGMQNYLAHCGYFPGAFSGSSAFYEKVALLPQLGLQTLYNSINVTTHAHSAQNKTALFYRIGVFLCPSQPAELAYFGPSNYPYCSGSGVWGDFNAIAVSKPGDGIGWGWPVAGSSVSDGLSQTATHAEQVSGRGLDPLGGSGKHPRMGALYYVVPIPATQARVMELCEGPLPIDGWAEGAGVPWLQQPRYTHLWQPGRHSCMSAGGKLGDVYSPLTANSWHGGGVNTLLADGHVRFVGNSVDVTVWRALGSRNGGEQLSRTDW